jgi:hypothetical protein
LQCLFLISLLAMAHLCWFSFSLFMVFEDTSWILNFSFVQLILFHHPILLFFSFLYMLCIFPDFCLLPVRLWFWCSFIPTQYCYCLKFLVVSVEFFVCIAILYFHHWVIWFYSGVYFLCVQCSWVNVTILVEILI